ncbi:hypothetical protein LTR10_002767 [Elasticomyces elasticus]|uniref:Apple domain-containing protein n=1 Tax=Elasticomyces elasticus TaxID=574655 RepID=A0AAN7W5F3_9PEZI|nr:hypothetical protein LTR10_002767 [Elasticomyces elasticus]KAK4967893.1 hypothetical protein LTR42_010221 [Elasticomyces elasticus]KAK5699536.1 hypothetical protein LTR97_005664 [Elasticomyces elasticus]
MKTFALFVGILPLLAASIPLTPSAGGPAFVPIPANCTIINPLPHADCGAGNTNGYMPTSNFSSSHLLYSAYFSANYNQSTQAQMCLEQCYGYGTGCVSALVAYQVGYHVSSGNYTSPTACFLYDAYLDPNKFVAAPEGQYVNETAGNIYCPL